MAVEKARAEEALQDSEAKYSAVVSTAADGVIIIRDRVIEFANDALSKIISYPFSEIDNPAGNQITSILRTEKPSLLMFGLGSGKNSHQPPA
jgi:PAS domain-containing protein